MNNRIKMIYSAILKPNGEVANIDDYVVIQYVNMKGHTTCIVVHILNREHILLQLKHISLREYIEENLTYF